MKKLLLVGLIMLFAGTAMAQLDVTDTLSKFPLKQGVAYDVDNYKVSYISTIEVANYKNISLEVGYSSVDDIIGVISLPIIKLKDFVNIPIIDLIEFNIGYYIGYSRIDLCDGMGQGNNEFVHGPSLTLLNVKF